MQEVTGLAGLGESPTTGLRPARVCRFRGPHGWVPVAVIASLGLVLVSAMSCASASNQAAAPEKTATVSATPVPERGATAQTEAKVTGYRCSQPPVFSEQPGREFGDVSMKYGLMAAESYGPVPQVGTATRTVWVFLGLQSKATASQQVNPWIDFWLMPLPLGLQMPYPPQPTRVDVLEIEGAAPLEAGERLLVEPGMACTLRLTFQTNPQADRAILSIGYVQAFNIAFTSVRQSP